MTAVDAVQRSLVDHRLGAATRKPLYLLRRESKAMRGVEQTYRCKCGWTGTHTEHERHRAQEIILTLLGTVSS